MTDPVTEVAAACIAFATESLNKKMANMSNDLARDCEELMAWSKAIESCVNMLMIQSIQSIHMEEKAPVVVVPEAAVVVPANFVFKMLRDVFYFCTNMYAVK